MPVASLRPRSLRNLPWTSPLRAFRLSSCLLVLTCLSVIFRPSLPGLLHLTTPFVTVHYLLLLSSLTFSLALGRHASVTLCHMVLKHTVSNPGHVVKSAAAAGQVAGPFVAAFILSWCVTCSVIPPAQPTQTETYFILPSPFTRPPSPITPSLQARPPMAALTSHAQPTD